ncbi:hypothetical protein [Demequina silvatica]|uniref:hypothetical protein n=1 Tax=Demequina silvatica TaxID=1638988 RepID=UPI000785014D|nr:hypothetical protein [Demequina silvatica]
MSDVLGSTQALEGDPVDDLAELADRADIVVTGRISAIEVSAATFATPDPATPEAVYGGQVLTATVDPADGERILRVEFIHQFSGDHALRDQRDVLIPDEDLVLALVPTGDPDGETYRCVADASWCPLLWNGEGLAASSGDGGTLPVLLADAGGERFSSIDEVTQAMVRGTDAQLVG